MLEQNFKFQLNQLISERMVTFANLENSVPSIIGSTVGGKLFVNKFESENSDSSQLSWLNFNKRITHIKAGCIDPSSNRDVLLVGTRNTLTAYDLYTNKDLFDVEGQDGITCVSLGYIGSRDELYVFVGSNCSIQAYDKEGVEKYWNMTSDNVLSICFVDIDEDDFYEIITGCEDSSINIFKGEELIYELDQTSPVSMLTSFGILYFGFALRNGSYGVYERNKLLWKEKYKEGVVGITSVFNTSKETEQLGLIIGFRNGKVEMRDVVAGTCLYKMMMNGQISSLLRSKFSDNNENQVTVVLRTGAVYGYDVTWDVLEKVHETKADLKMKISELTQQKNRLISQIKNLKSSGEGREKLLVPENTSLSCLIRFNFTKGCPELVLKTGSSAVIRGVVVKSDRIFNNDYFAYFEKQEPDQFSVPLHIDKNNPAEMQIKIFLGNSSSSKEYKVVEIVHKIQKFLVFCPKESISKGSEPDSYVKMKLQERIQRVVMWAKDSFKVNHKFIPSGEDLEDTLTLNFVNVQTKKPLVIEFNIGDEYSMVIKHSNMKLTSDIVQDMCDFLGVKELESIVHFPAEMARLKVVLDGIEAYSKNKTQVSADLVDKVQILKRSMVLGEDSRIIGDMGLVRKNFGDLMHVNRELTRELKARAKKNTDFQGLLKELKATIRKAGNMRQGSYRSKVISLCKTAIQEKDFYSFITVVNNGEK